MTKQAVYVHIPHPLDLPQYLDEFFKRNRIWILPIMVSLLKKKKEPSSEKDRP